MKTLVIVLVGASIVGILLFTILNHSPNFKHVDILKSLNIPDHNFQRTTVLKGQRTPLSHEQRESSVNSDSLYAIVLHVGGQQGAGMHSLVSFQCLTHFLSNSVKILEPVMVKTEYCGFDSTVSYRKGSVPFSDLFDLKHFNRISELMERPPIVPRNKFLASAPKNVVLVKVNGVSAKRSTLQIKVLWSAHSKASNPQNQKCYQESNRVILPLSRAGFCVIKVIDMQFDGQISPNKVQTFIDEDKSIQNVTIVFTEWRHYWYKSDVDFRTLLRPSARLILDAENYERKFLRSNNNVAVMFRMEHILRFLENQQRIDLNEQWSVEKCLLKAVEVTRTIYIQSSGRPMITLDIGKYGSDTTDMKLSADTRAILSPLFGNTSSAFLEWENSFSQATNGEENSAYIAALQRTLASRAKCLVLVGGGTFQRMSFDDYIINHPDEKDQCVNVICSLRSYEVVAH